MASNAPALRASKLPRRDWRWGVEYCRGRLGQVVASRVGRRHVWLAAVSRLVATAAAMASAQFFEVVKVNKFGMRQPRVVMVQSGDDAQLKIMDSNGKVRQAAGGCRTHARFNAPRRCCTSRSYSGARGVLVYRMVPQCGFTDFLPLLHSLGGLVRRRLYRSSARLLRRACWRWK